ncbi:DUF6049 family protein [Streptomyces pathocidini]|uniref:DUF6049 family protein n=1 Tax=Streptomyces pathocidini TaxID=1650571 RepID=A0ABW7USS7_9ACTN|nr:DUF6049 family protein [Streptomyces pathocidini]
MAEAAQFQGTRSAPARRWLRSAATVALSVPLLTGLTQLPAAPTAQAESTATGSRTVDVAINSLTPVSPTKNDTLTVKGTVTNDGSATITGGRIGLRLGPTLNSRSAIDTAAKRTGFSSAADGNEVGGKNGTVNIPSLRAGASDTFSLSVPIEDLDLDARGIYQLGVSLTGQTKNQPYRQVLGMERTFLPWQPSAVDRKTRLSFLWPLTSSTHLAAKTESDPQQTRIFRDDSLAGEIAPGGRLQQMVALGKGLPVTWVVDPDLLATVEAMTRSYKIQQPDGSTEAGKNQAVAKQWLDDLQKAVGSREVVALPFGDPDLASLAHRGKDVPGALGHLKSATDLASKTVETIVGVKPSTDFAWPVEGAIDTSVVDVATSAGAHNVITRSDSLHETGGLPYSPTAARPIGRGNTAVVADSRLSKGFEGDLARAEESTLAVQRFLAQTLMVTMQAPDRQRSIVVAPQRVPTAGQARTMAEAIAGLADARWTEPLDLGDAAKAKPDPSATTQVPGPGSYPGSLRREELPTRTFQDMQRAQNSLDRFKVILSQKDRVVTPIGNAIMRQMSASWRGDAQDATAYRDSVQGYLTDLSREVQLVQKSTQTLSGRSATIPVTVRNNLVQGVEGMKLVLQSSQPNRLEVDEEQTVRIEGGHSQSVKFDTTANANGTVWVTARLYAKDGTPYGAPMRFKVKVTEITSTVMLVIAGGVLLLVLAGIRMYTQRKRAARNALEASLQESAAAPGAPREPAPGEQQGDVVPDTEPESGDASGAGEKVDR